MENNTPTPTSTFNGSTLQLIGWRLLGFLLSIVTLGIGAPWAHCMIYRWEISHSSIDGQRLAFDGKGHQLLGKYLLWGLLTLITLGIYAIWIPVQMHRWKAGHTRFAAPGETQKSLPGLMILGIILGTIAAVALLFMGLRPLIAELPQKLPHSAASAERFFGQLFDDLKSPFEPAEPTEDPFSEGTFFMGEGGNGGTIHIIDNGDGTFTVVYGNPNDTTDTTEEGSGSVWVPESSDQANAYSFTDDERIIGSWLLRQSNPVVLMASELTLSADGTFSHFGDSYGRYDQWIAEGIAEFHYKGTYTYYNGELILYYEQGYSKPTSGDPSGWGWVPMSKTVSQQATFSDDGTGIYLSAIDEMMNGSLDSISYCPRMTGSIGDMLEAIYSN